MSYEVFRRDLSAIFAEQALVQKGKRIGEFFINDVPANTSFKLRVGLGENKQMTISRPFAMQPKGEDVQNDGLYLENPTAQAGSVIEIVVVYADTDLDPVI